MIILKHLCLNKKMYPLKSVTQPTMCNVIIKQKTNITGIVEVYNLVFKHVLTHIYYYLHLYEMQKKFNIIFKIIK